MKHRSEMRIVFDMLKVLEDKDTPMTLRRLFEKARIGYWHNMQERYTAILYDYDLARFSDYMGINPTGLITFKGHEFLKHYRELLRLMGEKE